MHVGENVFGNRAAWKEWGTRQKGGREIWRVDPQNAQKQQSIYVTSLLHYYRCMGEKERGSSREKYKRHEKIYSEINKDEVGAGGGGGIFREGGIRRGMKPEYRQNSPRHTKKKHVVGTKKRGDQ